jgi:hypothetical protein
LAVFEESSCDRLSMLRRDWAKDLRFWALGVGVTPVLHNASTTAAALGSGKEADVGEAHWGGEGGKGGRLEVSIMTLERLFPKKPNDDVVGEVGESGRAGDAGPLVVVGLLTTAGWVTGAGAGGAGGAGEK